METAMAMVPKSFARWEQANTSGNMALTDTMVPNEKNKPTGHIDTAYFLT